MGGKGVENITCGGYHVRNLAYERIGNIEEVVMEGQGFYFVSLVNFK